MRPLRFSPLAALLVALPVVSACGGDPSGGDAGSPDAYVLPPSELFGPCVEDSQCPGEGAVCRHDEDGYPRGHCTVPCEDRTPCDVFGVYHHCIAREGETQRYCEQRCLNGLDCGRTAFTCAGELPPSGGVCIGVCAGDADCSEGHVCEPYSATCYPDGTAPTTGAVTGEPCASDDACRSGACLEEVTNDVPTGNVGGMCVSNCSMPTGYNSNNFFDGPSLPRGACATGSICFVSGSFTEGDLGVCLPECTSDGDCRPGYGCAQSFNTASGMPASFDNGVCLPIDCAAEACPTGYTCERIPRADGSTRNVCAP